ncbi:hypothetical protein [Bacillus thuringiensis]|uniref:hypothetical protein n=1 Tax=Bacillus thuringiensis TaxID=1428 RepID=UPI0021B37B7B|nr:hypothetical protein [Bacillus thuringiensis]
MARVFHLTLGSIEKFAVAESIEDMHDRRAEIEPTFAYTPVEIQELHIPGYVIGSTYDSERRAQISRNDCKRGKLDCECHKSGLERTLGTKGCGSEK